GGTIAAAGVTIEPQTVEVRETKLATSRDAPELLAATYLTPDSTGPTVVTQQTPPTLDVTALNSGGALWLSPSTRTKDVVRLEWQWMKDGQRLPMRGTIPLVFDVFPGQRYRFEAPIESLPPTPGTYTLDVVLVGGAVKSFPGPHLRPVFEIR